MRLIWDEQARSDLVHIRRYIARDNPAAAAQVAVRIRARILGLLEYPLLGHEGRTSHTRELVIAGLPYIAIYRVNESRETIEVLRIVHGAQLYPADN